MAFNGSGTFVIDSAGQPVVANTIIDETVFNAFTADIATGLSTCITKDGQTTPTANIPMGGFKLTGLAAATANGDAVRYEQWSSVLPLTNDLRLSLVSGNPAPTADTTGTTIYAVPNTGNRIALYNGTTWIVYALSAQMSLALGTLTANLPYDVFCYDNAGTPTLEFTAWSSATARATDLARQNGVVVKNGAATRRYLGTFYTVSTTETTDSFAKRFLWNYYHRLARPMRVFEATNSWNYTTATIRQANASTANQLDFVIGVSEDQVEATVAAYVSNDAPTVTVQAGIGLDTTTAFSTGQLMAPNYLTVINAALMAGSTWSGYTGIGRHFLSWNEVSQAAGTTTWWGDFGSAATHQSGIIGVVWG